MSGILITLIIMLWQLVVIYFHSYSNCYTETLISEAPSSIQLVRSLDYTKWRCFTFRSIIRKSIGGVLFAILISERMWNIYEKLTDFKAIWMVAGF